MAFLKDSVVESANNPGTGTVNLAGVATGPFVSFGTRFSSGDEVYYGISDEAGKREIGRGIFTAGTPDTLSRIEVYSNTSGTTAKLNFTGLVFVYATLPAEKTIFADENGDVALGGDLTVTGTVVGSNVPAAPTWHDVTGSRALGATYTNTNSYQISAMVVTLIGGASVGLSTVTVNGAVISKQDLVGSGSGINYSTNFQVPAGQTYVVSGGGLVTWFELY